MAGGSITVSNGAGDALSVTITGGTWKAAADLSGEDVSFPDAITASKTYYTGADNDIVVSVKRRGFEIAGSPDGTRMLSINGGKNLTFTPGPDPDKGVAAGEIFEASSGAVQLPEITLDGGSEVAPANDEFAIGVDGDGDLAFYDGSAWVKAGAAGAGFESAQVYYGYDATQFSPSSITPNPPDGSFAVGIDPSAGWYDVYQRIGGEWVETDPDSNHIQEALVRNAAREETTGLALDALLDFYGAPITEITVLTTIFQAAFTAGQAAAWLDVAKGTLELGINCNTTDRDTLLGLFTPGYPMRGNVAIAGNWDGYVTNAIASGGTWGTGVFVSMRLFDDVSVNNVSNAMDVPDETVPQLWYVDGSSTGALFNNGVFGAVDVSNRFLVKNNENTRWVAGPVMEDFVVDDSSTTSSVWDAQAQQIVVSVNQNLLDEINADIASKAPLAYPALPVKTVDYTLALGDAGDLIQMDTTTTITLTVPENATVAFPIGTRIDILGTNTGTVTVAAVNGSVKVDSKDGNLSLAGRWSKATLIKRATNDWVLVGDLAGGVA